jgi:predicted MPP superfamily phosphohydrolase
MAASGREDSGVWRDRLLEPLLKTGLQLGGLYRRGLANALRPVVRHLRLEFAGLPPGLDGFRILHLSDFHIDGMDGLAEIVAEQLAFLSVDLCVLTGDYRFKVFGACDAIYPRMRRILSAIRSRHGIVGILGNHDCADVAVGLEKLGVRMLIDEAIHLGAPGGRMSVIGIDHPHDDASFDPAAAIAGVAGGATAAATAGAIADVQHPEFQLLLAHSPDVFREAAEAGIDLCLSGHTHAGQIRLPLIGPITTNARCPRAYTQGHWRHGGMQGHTTAGVGCSMLPVRFGCPPEIMVLELAKG